MRTLATPPGHGRPSSWWFRRTRGQRIGIVAGGLVALLVLGLACISRRAPRPRRPFGVPALRDADPAAPFIDPDALRVGQESDITGRDLRVVSVIDVYTLLVRFAGPHGGTLLVRGRYTGNIADGQEFGGLDGRYRITGTEKRGIGTYLVANRVAELPTEVVEK